MNTHDIFRFISKAIQKTNENELTWCTLPNNFDIKPIPGEAHSLPKPSDYRLSERFSYYSAFKTGYLLLLVYALPTLSFIPAPPGNCIISLRMQDSQSPFAIEISNTNDDKENANTLMRLYNLIDKRSSSVNVLINDFLDS